MRLVFIGLLLTAIVGTSHAQQQSDTYTRKEVSQTYINPPGYRQMKVGKGLTIGGSVLLVTGIVLMASADETYYTSTSTQYGTEEEGDPKFALGLLSAMGGVGMIIPGAILWSKGSKKFKAYQQNKPQANLSLGVNHNGFGLRLRF